MEEEKKDKIVESLLFIMAAIGGILVVTTALIFAFNMNLLFGLFILGVALVMTSLTISELYSTTSTLWCTLIVKPIFFL